VTRRLSVVIPVYNSRDNLAPLHAALVESLSSFSKELIFVNDGSTDDSWTQIEALTARHPDVVGVDLRRNFGQDCAIMAGLHYASGEYVVIMDDDLQHHPRDIPRLYDAIVKGYDVCYANFPVMHQAWWKNLGSYLNGKMAEIVMGKPPHVYLSAFKIVSRGVADEIVAYQGPYPYVDGLLFQFTDNVTQVAVEHHRRHAGRSNMTFWKSLMTFVTLSTNFSLFPLRVVTTTGLLLSTLSFLSGAYFLLVYLTVGITVAGWTSIALTLLFLGGAILTSLGIIGEYVGRVLMNVNGAPQFVVRRSIPPDRKPGSLGSGSRRRTADPGRDGAGCDDADR
jgi:undecaprenyl-phosphate 4-deoxy-4-formamido-L-arabinose transferase